MDDSLRILCDYAADLAKQMMTLSTGILGVTAAFAKDIAKEAPPKAVKSLRMSWMCYLWSLVFGIWMLMAITGTVGRIVTGEVISHSILLNIRIPSIMQVITFLAGTYYVINFASHTLQGTTRISRTGDTTHKIEETRPPLIADNASEGS